MKRLWMGLLLIVLCLSGCTITKLDAHDETNFDVIDAPTTDVSMQADIELGDTHFATHVSEIATDPESYLGMTVRLQGYIERYGNDPDIQFAVLRDYDDGEGVTPWGFDCYYEGDLPQNGDWVDVVGELSAYEVATGERYLRLHLSSLTPIPQSEQPSRLVYD